MALALHDPDSLLQQHREDLVAAFRWFARMDWHEAHANHFSFAVNEDGSQFLINPRGRHFASVRASELLLLDANDAATMDKSNAPDPTAWCIHSAIHRLVPHARCIMHLHSPGALALACLQDKTLPPIDNNTARFFNRLAVDDAFNGLGLDDQEGERLAGCLGEKSVLLMGNHGVLVGAASIAQAFDDLYYFERACATYITVLSTGKSVAIMNDEIAEKTARQWEGYDGFAASHLREVREILEREESEYKN